MVKSQKIWVIDEDGKNARVVEKSVTGSSRSGNEARNSTRVGTLPSAPPRARSAPPKKEVTASDRSLGLLVALTYLLGPFNLVLTAQGRRNKTWLILGITTGLVSVVLAVTWQDCLARFTSGSAVAGAWFLTAILTIGMGFTVWARGLYVNGSSAGLAVQRLPWWCRAPVAVGFLGFLLPGFGMLVMGRPGRAAWALWSLGPVAQAILVLTHAGWLWRGNEVTTRGFPSGFSLEIIFLSLTAILAAGVLVWLLQALDAVRLVTHGVGARRSRRVYWLAAALVCTLVLFGVKFDPARLAGDLDRYATSLGDQGMQLIPLTLTLGAVQLDSSQPVYVIHTADLYSQMGREDRAVALRQELSAKWSPYFRTLQRDGRWAVGAAPSLRHGNSPAGNDFGDVRPPVTGDRNTGHQFRTPQGKVNTAAMGGEDARHGPYLDVVPDLSGHISPH